MAHRVLAEVAERALQGGVPEDEERAACAADKCGGASKQRLAVGSQELVARAFLVEVDAYLLRVPYRAVERTPCLAARHERREPCAALNAPPYLAQPFEGGGSRNFAFHGLDGFFYLLLVGIDVGHAHKACLAAVHHELVEHLLRRVVHVESAFAVLGEQDFHPCQRQFGVVLVEPGGIARAFLHPDKAVGIHKVADKVACHKVGLQRCIEGRQRPVHVAHQAEDCAYRA